MTGDRAKDDQVVRLVRQHLAREETGWEEPDEPLPQDCCGQSCLPCVFDIHRKDLVEWAKETAKQIEYEEGSLYNFVYGDDVDVNSNSETILSQYSFLEITNITPLTKDTNLYSFAVKGLRLPLGAHLRARISVAGHHVSRQYTPTAVSCDGFQVPIKIYDGGKFTKHVKEWVAGTRVEWRGPYVTDHGEWLKNASHLLLVAAGTGIAPFIRIVSHLLDDDNFNMRIKLIYCSRNVEDLICKETVASWTKHWNFSLDLVLTESNISGSVPHLATVHKGRRLSQDLFSSILTSFSQTDSAIRIAACGSKSFEKDVINFSSRGAGLSVDKIFRFPG